MQNAKLSIYLAIASFVRVFYLCSDMLCCTLYMYRCMSVFLIEMSYVTDAAFGRVNANPSEESFVCHL